MGTAVAAAIAAGPDKRQPMDPRGEPPGLKKGITECFKVWHNDDGWHVRVVNGRGSRDHRYQGTITVENGEIENLRSHLAKVNGVEKQWKHTAKKNQISFDFATSQNEDGINFRTSKGATIIRFSLKIDGDEVPQQIYVGKLGDHPDSATFVVPAHPTNRSIEQVTGNSKRPVK
jgi:hypothetical protein